MRFPFALLLLLAPLVCAQDAPPQYPYQLPKEKQEVLDRMRQTSVSLDLANAPLDQALSFVKDKLQLEVDLSRVDKPATRKVTVKVADMDAISALRLVLDPLKLAFVVEPTKLIVAPPDKLPAGTPEEEVLSAIAALKAAGHGDEGEDMETAATRRTLKAIPLHLDFKDQTLAEALKLIANYTRFTVAVEPAAESSGKLGDKISTAVHADTTWQGLEDLLGARGLGFWLGGGAVHVDLKDVAARRNAEREKAKKQSAVFLDKATSVQFQGASIQKVAEDLGKVAGLPVVMDADTWNAQAVITFEEKDKPLREVLDELRTQCGACWYLYKGKVYLVR